MGTKELAQEMFTRVGQRELTVEEHAEVMASLLETYPGSSKEDTGMLFFAFKQEREILIRNEIADKFEEQRMALFFRFAQQQLAA